MKILTFLQALAVVIIVAAGWKIMQVTRLGPDMQRYPPSG
jgi:hypothetical protein